jgi:hypothetical protein
MRLLLSLLAVLPIVTRAGDPPAAASAVPIELKAVDVTAMSLMHLQAWIRDGQLIALHP